jgi:large conductance mechanosensitive channel
MLNEFRKFISRGNVMDLAVAVVIGAAFTSIVNSLVDDIIMPIVGVFLGGVDFSALSITIGDATIAYGNFIQSVITFLIIAFVVFLMVKAVNKAQELAFGEEEEEAPAPEEPSAEVKLLTEIRDLLKEQETQA